ncbi:MAG: hypothetical protein WC184_07630 [Acidimicrobiia bacterium]
MLEVQRAAAIPPITLDGELLMTTARPITLDGERLAKRQAKLLHARPITLVG